MAASSAPRSCCRSSGGCPWRTIRDLLVGTATADDAGVYRLADGLALVQTVDFFTPIVDDPYDFGRIAAANALSDVYAMGGRPLTALNLVAFPLERLGADVLGEILRGGLDVCAEAGATVVGGHSIDDPEPKFGLAVTGVVDPAAVADQRGRARRRRARRSTKPLGVGAVSTAWKRGAPATAQLAGGRGHDDAAQRGRRRGGPRGRRARPHGRDGLRPARATCTRSPGRAASRRRSTPPRCRSCPGSTRCSPTMPPCPAAAAATGRTPTASRPGGRRPGLAAPPRVRRDDVGRAARGGPARGRRRGSRPGHRPPRRGRPGRGAVR